MNKNDFEKRANMHSMGLAAESIVRTLNMLGGYQKVRQLRPILCEEEGVTDSDLRRALDYLAESGYIAVRTFKDKEAADVADAMLDELECKLLPKGTRLAGGYERDLLVDP